MTSAIHVSRLAKSFGSSCILEDIDFRVEQGEFVTLLGPSGCGKTTTLRCIAGLEQPTAGTITIGGACVFSSADHINLAPEKRRLGMVFQSYAIWPHMSVAENVAYGLHARQMKVPRAEIAEKVERALDMVGLPGFGSRYATELSGGQQQRVALARSLVIEPQVLLLDEPLSNLDAKMRERMRFELKELQRRLGLTAVYVTHDQSEALALSDRIIVMEHGRIIQQGSSEQIFYDPQSKFVLDFIGQANFMTGKLMDYDTAARSAAVTLEDGSIFVGEVPLDIARTAERGEVSTVALRPQDIHVSTTLVNADTNTMCGRIVSQLFLGTSRELLIKCGAHTLKAQISSGEHLSDGQDVWLSVPDHAVRILP